MKAVFLDRDGIINVDRGTYTHKISDFQIQPDIIQVLHLLKSHQYKLIVVTNQAGISRGLYTRADMQQCHDYFQEKSGHVIDAFYHAPAHPTVSSSLSRKPDSLMFERAISRFSLDTEKCWMVGDMERDLIPARRLKIRTIFVNTRSSIYADFRVTALRKIPEIILG